MVRNLAGMVPVLCKHEERGWISPYFSPQGGGRVSKMTKSVPA